MKVIGGEKRLKEINTKVEDARVEFYKRMFGFTDEQAENFIKALDTMMNNGKFSP